MKVRLITDLSSSKLIMDTPGGVVVRPPKRIYDPTFWPLYHFIHIQDEGNGRGLAILQVLPEQFLANQMAVSSW